MSSLPRGFGDFVTQSLFIYLINTVKYCNDVYLVAFYTYVYIFTKINDNKLKLKLN